MVIPTIPNIPALTRDPVTAFLNLVVQGRIGDPFNPGKVLSQRGLARLVGISESTLRTAFRTAGRAPSARTLARLDAALRGAPEGLFVTRTQRRGIVTDTLTPLGQRYYISRAPVGARSWRVVVETGDDNYRYKTLTPISDPDARPEDFFGQWAADGLNAVRVYWDVD